MTETGVPGSDLKAKLREYVHSFYKDNSRPLLLSKIGNHLREIGYVLPEGTSLLSFIESEFADELVVERHPNQPSIIAIATKDNEEEIREILRSGHSASESLPRSISDIPRALLIAFGKTIDGDALMYFRRSPPFRYKISQDNPGDDYIQIPESLRLPGLHVGDASSLAEDKKELLFERVTTWMKESKFMVHSRPTPSSGTEKKTALERLVAAQPESIRSRVMIPADIAQILLGYE